MYSVKFTKQAAKDAKKLKSAGLDRKQRNSLPSLEGIRFPIRLRSNRSSEICRACIHVV